MNRLTASICAVAVLLCAFACLEENTEDEEARTLAILTGQVDAEQAGGTALVAFRNEFDPGSCPAWYVNVNKDDDTKSVISSTSTGDTSPTVTIPAPELYDLDIQCSNGSGGSVERPAQGVEEGRSYLLHYKSDGSLSFAEHSF